MAQSEAKARFSKTLKFSRAEPGANDQTYCFI